MTGYPCPTCGERPLETVVRAPYVRGYLLAYEVGGKRFLGCTKCVASDLRKEALKSLLLGWFSITALVLNPIFVNWNFLRSFFVGKAPDKVTKLLLELGMPESPAGPMNASEVGVILAACMIRADGEVEASEVSVAVQIGGKLFQDFDAHKLQTLLAQENLPDPGDLAGLFRDSLDDETKKAVYGYLFEIANADGRVSQEERVMLASIASHMRMEGWQPPT